MCPNQITGASSTSSMDDSSFSGQGESDLSPILNPIMTCVSLTPPIRERPSDTSFLEIRRRQTTRNSSTSSQRPPRRCLRQSRLRRCHRPPSESGVVNGMKPIAILFPSTDDKNSSEDGSGGLKRGKHATRVPGGAGSTNRIRRSPSTRTQQISKSISKAVGRGAERLASTTARELYHRSLLGLSVSQGSVGALEQEQPSWIEEREQMEARYDVGSSVPLQSVENARDGKLYKIPGKLTERERLMLQMTQADEERGAVRVIKCRVCPEREFGGWLTFRRHCNSCEKHPSALKFCSKCGDYFGRPDSEDRHKGKKYQGACLSTSQDEAKQKEQKVGRLLEAFEARLKHCLRTGEEIRPLFSDVVTKKLTNTSKKVSKREETWVEGNSWADGL
ncbi:hypothetical protein EDB83DRAFT_95950 [Lactarius deliciosus]|nr:hypothetical protein EDB83DRAFT_95950 [Lactarius deliciosus]